MTGKQFGDWMLAFLMLRPACGPIFLRVTWIAFLLFESVGFLNLFIGTVQVYSWRTTAFATLLTLISAFLFLLVRIAIVRILLEVASQLLVRELTGRNQNINDSHNAT